MLKQIHFLLTYTCNFRCDHCFLYSGPEARGTFTVGQLRRVFREIPEIGTIEKVFFEGGESFLYYPLLLEGIRMANELGLETGIVTNAYWATSVEDAELWLKPLYESGVSDISLSDDPFHFEGEGESPAQRALAAAKNLGIPAGTIYIEAPSVKTGEDQGHNKGAAIIGGNVVFRGRAVEKLTAGLPVKKFDTLSRCPYEDLENPGRVHVDAYGHVHLCQGLIMGNMWETPLSSLVKIYDASLHPISGPLTKGGPAFLAKEHAIVHDNKYIDECHFCYLIRMMLIDKFPQYLAPRQVYGLE
ncbi:MAG: radical SAM protein [FCB group bacterium]|nr:radical SAM protein [FCB group bacterium]